MFIYFLTKSLIMKNLILGLIFLPICLFCQSDNDPTLFEVINIEVKPGQEKAFEAAVKAHNKKFHPEGIYAAHLYSNLNGPNGGKYTWIMGPTTFTALDSRPGEGAHDDDWKNVTAVSQETDSPRYWSSDAKLSHRVVNAANTKSLIWIYDIKPNQEARWSELIAKVKKVYDEKRPTESFGVSWNEFSDTKAGNDVAIIFSFDKWSWMDRKSNFIKDFEEVFGAGSWHTFLNAMAETVDGRVDWLRTKVD